MTFDVVFDNIDKKGFIDSKLKLKLDKWIKLNEFLLEYSLKATQVTIFQNSSNNDIF